MFRSDGSKCQMHDLVVEWIEPMHKNKADVKFMSFV